MQTAEKVKCFKVFELTKLIKETLEAQFYAIQVEGEISNLKPSSAGHFYFNLKDAASMISAVFFKNSAKNLPFPLADGQLVRVFGDVSVYPQRGNYQIICHSIEKVGQGEILAELERRKKKFAEAGFFDESRKKKIPMFPQKIGVVTSPTGAAIKDILRVLKRRNNKINVLVLPALVQGEEAAYSIASQIKTANMLKLVDILIVGRGGGSLEDLLPFSSDDVVKAIYKSEIPVISAVGHEIDFALSDFAADLRAPTPSAAAEIVSMESTQIEQRLVNAVESMALSMSRRTEMLHMRLDAASPVIMKNQINKKFYYVRQKLDDTHESNERLMREKIKLIRLKLALLASNISASSPAEILKKGYAAIFSSYSGEQIKSAFETKTDDIISVRFANDFFSAKITSNPIQIHKNNKEEKNGKKL